MTQLQTVHDALEFQRSLGAPPVLVHHHVVVAEVTAGLVPRLATALRIQVDETLLLLGAALHDCGKIVHPRELAEPGKLYEEAGEELLLAHGLPAELSRFARTHAQWRAPDAELEDHLVALADKLWKGKRDVDLEAAVLRELEMRTAAPLPAWQVLCALEEACDEITEYAEERLRGARKLQGSWGRAFL